MSVTICFVLLLIGLLLLVLGRKRRGLQLAALASLLFYLLGTGMVPAWILAGLQEDPFLSSPVWKSKNAIVVLGAGTSRWTPEVITTPAWANGRVMEAARLYSSCRRSGGACVIVASGGDPNQNGVSEAEIMARELIAIGVPSSDIVREERSRNTFQNAKFTAPLVRDGAYESVVLVTSGFHLRRARLFFEFFDIHATPAPADRLQAINAYVPVSFNFVFTDLAMHEYFGVLQFHVFNWMGWNS